MVYSHALSRPAFLPEDVVFESFTFPLFDFNFVADHSALAQAFLSKADEAPDRGTRAIYIHIPFCDAFCEFCPFFKVATNEKTIERYMAALYREIDLMAGTPFARSWKVGAIYVGGGTPSTIGAVHSERLLMTLRQAFSVTDDAEISYELEPKSAHADLIEAIKKGGANRVSFGVQTLDPELRDLVNLTATREDIERTAQLCRSSFDRTNLDMIVGFPGQDADQAVADVEAAARLHIDSISLYPMDYITVMPKLLDKIRSKRIPMPVFGPDRWALFHRAREALQKHYHAQNMYCFGNATSPPCRYMFDVLYGTYYDQCIGLGAGAYTMIRGLAYSSAPSIEKYVEALTRGQLPIERTSPGHAYEKEFVYMPKRLRATLSGALQIGIGGSILPKIEALVNAGYLTCNGDTVAMTELGRLNYAQIMVSFLSDTQRRLYDGASVRLTKQLNWGIQGPLDERKSSARGLGTRNALPRKSIN